MYIIGLCADNNDTYCPGLFFPVQFGYNKKTAGSRVMGISFDVHSLTTALAVNMQLLNISDLEVDDRNEQFQTRVQNLIKNNFITYEESFYFQPYYDPYYAPMDSVYCIVKPVVVPESPPDSTNDDEYSSIANEVYDSKAIVLYLSQVQFKLHILYIYLVGNTIKYLKN